MSALTTLITQSTHLNDPHMPTLCRHFVKLIVSLTISSGLSLTSAASHAQIPQHTGQRFAPHVGLSGGAVIARERGLESRRQLPWRPLESSTLTPLRLEVGATYHFGGHPHKRVDVGGALYQRGLYLDAPLSALYADSVSEGHPALGELSMTWPLTPNHRLTFGRLLYRVNAGDRGAHLYHVGQAQALSPEAWEERYWSWSGSPLERWSAGVSLGGALWSSDEPPTQRGPKGPPRRALSYRVSALRPHERLDLIDGRGVVLTGATRFEDERWGAELQAIWGYQLSLSDELKSAADETLRVASASRNLRSLSDVTVDYSATWWRGAGWLRLGRSARMSYWASATVEARRVDASQLTQLEEAALAEANVIGDGLATCVRVYAMRDVRRDVPRGETSLSALPHRWELSYQSRDPDERFDFDMRHRLTASARYDLITSWGVVSSTLWYQHLWSASANRFAFESDLAGLSVEIRR